MNLKNIFYIIIILFFSSNALAQTDKHAKEGIVSYISPQMVYLKFVNTEGIHIGDTLYSKNNKPKLIVKFISSISVSCEKLNGLDVSIGSKFYAFVKEVNETELVQDANVKLSNNVQDTVPLTQEISQIQSEKGSPILGNDFNGRYSVNSYSNVSNYKGGNNYQSWRHSLKIDYNRIGYSSLSFSTYSVFVYKTIEWNQISNNFFNALKVYDVNLKYEFTRSNFILLGRFLNPKTSNLSTVDGILFETRYKTLGIGLVFGSRPDWKDFGFNPRLIEFGAYIFRTDSFAIGSIENTISFFQQTNKYKIDRRFIYLQHSNNIFRKINLFASTEVDLFKREFGVSKNQFSFTSIFLLANYHAIREFDLSLSYDARKNVIYYETFKSFADSIIENETRQGIRFRTTLKPFKYFGATFFVGYRFKHKDPKSSRNFGGSLYYSFIPIIQSSLNLSYNKLITNYVDCDVYSTFLSKNFYLFNSDISIGFRKTKYKFPVSVNSFDENVVLVDYSLNIFRTISLSISYEGAFEYKRTTSRILISLSSRF